MPHTISSYHDLVRTDALAMLVGCAGTVLDFGGGVGASSASLKDAGRAEKIVLMDQVAETALQAVDHAIALDLNNAAQVKAALAQSGPFDTVLCLDVLEHLVDPWAVIAQLEGALRPGGTMIVSLPNASHHSVLLPLIFRGRFDYQDAGIMDRTHLRWFTKATSIELASSGALQLEVVEPNLSGRRDQWLNRMTWGLLERFFAKQYRLKLSKLGS